MNNKNKRQKPYRLFEIFDVSPYKRPNHMTRFFVHSYTYQLPGKTFGKRFSLVSRIVLQSVNILSVTIP